MDNTVRGNLPYPHTGQMHITNFNASTTPVVGTAVRIARFNPTRASLIIQNRGGVNVYLGPNSAVSANEASANRGLLLASVTPYGVYSDPTNNGEVWAITAGGGADLCVVEIYPDSASLPYPA